MQEMQFRKGMNAQSLTQLITQKSGSGLQAFECVLQSGWVIDQRGEKNLRMRVIWRELDFSQRDHANARIFEFHGDQFGEITLDLIGDALASGGDGFAVLGHGWMELKNVA